MLKARNAKAKNVGSKKCRKQEMQRKRKVVS
jgi:hypothetical protein